MMAAPRQTAGGDVGQTGEGVSPPAAGVSPPADPVTPLVASAGSDTSDPSNATTSPATSEVVAFRATEVDLPESGAGMLFLAGGVIALFGLSLRTSLRDSRFLRPAWRAALLVPRLVVLLLVLVIALNPRERTQLSRVEKSRVGILIDSSLSMAWPSGGAATPPDADSVARPASQQSRSAAVGAALIESRLLSRLSETHAVSIYTFDSVLEGPKAVIQDQSVRFSEAGQRTASGAAPPDSGAAPPDSGSGGPPQRPSDPAGASDDSQKLTEEVAGQLEAIWEPRGAETRLGESLHQLIGQISGRTLSGLVVISDGCHNAGLDPEAAHARAERSGTRLITVGVGSQEPQMNIWVAGMQSPEDVHRGDPFDISVVIQGSGIGKQPVLVRLFQQSVDSDGRDRRQVAEQSAELGGDGLPITVRFTQQQPVPGKYEFIAQVEQTVAVPADALVEMTQDDNERRREIEVSDRRIRVLLISSGPMRDYQFVRNTVFRHSGIESDVWLQTVTEEGAEFVTQEARRTLTRFPATEAALFEYDVIVAFDPDWSRLTQEERGYLNRWVSDHSGGLIVVAGEIHTPKLAQEPDAWREISVLYPVMLNRMLPELQISQRADQPWPVRLTVEGRSAEFLRIADATGNARAELWEQFRGVYRSYPVRSLRDGAVALLEYGNPRARTEIWQPPFLASQFYGTGRTVFIGSAETWRLREISPQGHQRFWTSLIREVGQGRRTRGTARGLLLLDRTETTPGQAVNIRAQLYNARLQPLQSESTAISILDPDGQPVPLPERLNPDGRGAGLYVGNFRPARTGTFRISVPVPESSDVLQATVEVVRPNLESRNASRNSQLLTALSDNTGGRYLALADLPDQLPNLLPDRSEPVVVDEQLKTLWDRGWLLYLLVALLGLEWAMRRFVRLS